jgi:hypothetical protein
MMNRLAKLREFDCYIDGLPCDRHKAEVRSEKFDDFMKRVKEMGCVRCLQERLNKADEVISMLDEFIGQSQGITGYHLNGDTELWEDTGLCELVDTYQRLDPNYRGNSQKESVVDV